MNRELNASRFIDLFNSSIQMPKPISTDLNCYMNSLIKCLYYIPELRDFFIKNKGKFKNNQKVCKIFANIMYNLKYNTSHHFNAKELEEIIDNKNNELISGRANDSKCLFSSLIDSFLFELNSDTNNYDYDDDNVIYEDDNNDDDYDNDNDIDDDYDNDDFDDDDYGNYDYSNKKQMFNLAEKEIDKNNIINKLFLCFYETEYKCKSYKLINIYSFQNEYFISFNLEKIKKYFEIEDINLTQCFEYYCRMQCETEFFCNKCNKNEKNYCFDKIYRAPLILVIVLNRGNDNKFDGILMYEPDLDLTKFIDEKDSKFGTKYKIISIPKQYSACSLTDSGYFYLSDTFTCNVRKTQLERDEPFLLFYRRID